MFLCLQDVGLWETLDLQPPCESLFYLLLLLSAMLPLISNQSRSVLKFSVLSIQISHYCVFTGPTLCSWINKDKVFRLTVLSESLHCCLQNQQY